MTRLSEFQVNEFCDTLIGLCRKQGKKGEQLYAVEILVQRFRRAYERDKAGSAIPDGYPAGSSLDGGGGGGLHISVENEQGDLENVDVTGVEWAMFQRDHQPKSRKDHHHDLTLGLVSNLVAAVKNLDEAYSKLARIENLVDLAPNADEIKGCRSHARLKDGLGRSYYQPIAREDGARDGLCRWCYGYASEHEGGMPPPELVDRLIRNGRVTSKDIDEVNAAARRRSA